MNKIVLGDCLDIMPTIPNESIDMILCDLPYGITKNKWDAIIPLDKLWEQYKRIIKDNGAIVLFATQPFTSKLVMSNLDMFKYDWTWRKPKGTGHLNSKKMPMKDKEDILVFYKKQCTYNPQFTTGKPFKARAGTDSQSTNYGKYSDFRYDNDGIRYPKQVIEFGVVEVGTIHPTQKPVPLLEYLIKTYTNENELVLDNCMGSGSTIIAAINTKRNYIGIEKDSHYFSITEKRINERLNTLEKFL